MRGRHWFEFEICRLLDDVRRHLDDEKLSVSNGEVVSLTNLLYPPVAMRVFMGVYCIRWS